MPPDEELRKLIARYHGGLKKRLEELLAKIELNLVTSTDIDLAVSEAFKDIDFFEGEKQHISDLLFLAACAGYGALPRLVVNPDAIKDKLLSESWTPDKMPLSRRLHHGTEQQIKDTIRRSFAAAKTVQELANDLYDGYNHGHVLNADELPKYLSKLILNAQIASCGDATMIADVITQAQKIRYQGDFMQTEALKAAYKKLASLCVTLDQRAVEHAAYVAVQEKTRYDAMRIARTEAVRAWFDGYIADTQGDDEIWGYKWRLSSRHYLCPFDQCDVAANMDVGWGKGIYPKGKVPSIPRHPHCMCMLSEVFEWEIDNKDRQFRGDAGKKYIQSLSKHQQEELLGKAGVIKLKHGGDWEKLLRGWQGFEKPKSRLSRSDFDECKR